jgi:hypothetical protein
MVEVAGRGSYEVLLERLIRLRVEVGAIERVVRELGANKQHLRLVADLFETLNGFEALLARERVDNCGRG